MFRNALLTVSLLAMGALGCQADEPEVSQPGEYAATLSTGDSLDGRA